MHVTSICLQSVKRGAKKQKQSSTPTKKGKKLKKNNTKSQRVQQEKDAKRINSDGNATSSSVHTSDGTKTQNQGRDKSNGKNKGVQVT